MKKGHLRVRPAKAGVFSGRQTRRGKSQPPVTRVAGWREIKTLKPTDKAIERMVSESSGRNESERRAGPEKPNPGGRARMQRAKAA